MTYSNTQRLYYTNNIQHAQTMTKVNIQVEEQTREQLSSLGKHKETYDDIIARLLSQNKTQKKTEVRA